MSHAFPFLLSLAALSILGCHSAYRSTARELGYPEATRTIDGQHVKLTLPSSDKPSEFCFTIGKRPAEIDGVQYYLNKPAGRKNLSKDDILLLRQALLFPAIPKTSALNLLIDPGHGGYDGGARCRDSGVWEKSLNLAVALEVEAALRRQGAAVVMTRREDVDLCEADRPANLTKKRQDMQNRIALAQENQVDMVLSIHMNEYRARGESGPQVFYREGCDPGRLLAGCIQTSLISYLQPKKERTAMAGDYFILQLEVPSVLVECGFISNPQEEQLLLSPDYQSQLAEAIAKGVTEYCQLSN